MPEEQMPQNPEPEKSKVRVTPTPLSIVEFGPYSILLYNRAVYIPQENGSEEVTNEVMLQLRRPKRTEHDDPNSIPLTAVPILAMAFEEIAKSAMSLTPIRTQPPEAPPAPTSAPKKVQPPKKNKKR